MKNKDIAKTAMALSLAIVLGYIESLFPLPVPIPGVKLGLSNLAIIYVLYRIGIKYAFITMLLKVTIVSILFSGFGTFFYSFMGGLLSLIAMIEIKKMKGFGISGVSAVGGVMHNVGQLIAASIILKSVSVFYYLPYLLISGMIFGLILGMLSKLLLKYI